MKKEMSIALIVLLFLSFLIFTNNKFPIFYSLSGFIQKVFSRPFAFSYSLKAQVQPFSSENKEERKNIETKMEMEKLKKDNQALRDQFENGSIPTQKLIPAQVVGFNGHYNFPNTLIIDRGEDDYIKKGSVIISGKNLVGVVVKTSKNFSQVMLPTNRDFSIIGKTSGTNASGVIQGEADFILFDKVVITDELKKDDIIITKGEIDNNGIGIPPDLIVGKISSINKSENKPFQNAKIKNIIDYSKLETVFVVNGLN